MIACGGAADRARAEATDGANERHVSTNSQQHAVRRWQEAGRQEAVSVRDRWAYNSTDAALALFTAALLSCPEATVTGRVLEIGCAEADWLSLAQAADPALELHGIDWRRCHRPGTIVHGDVREPDRYPAASFDTIVSLSTIEHIGLGHYSGDPLDPDGDRQAARNAWHWLKPGGWLYFDVPYQAIGGLRVHGTEYRVYDWPTIRTRLLPPWVAQRWTGWATAQAPGQLVDPPSVTQTAGGFSHYLAVWAQKDRLAP